MICLHINQKVHMACKASLSTRSSAIAEGPRDTLVSTNLATTKHPILKWLQSTNELEVYTPKVIVIAAFT